MAGPASAVGDDRRGAFHHRLPVGVGHVGNEDVAVADLVHLSRIEHQPRGAGADALSDAPPLGQHLSACLQLEALDRLPGETALHRLGAGLEDPQAPVHPVARPLDVHRPPVVTLDGHRMPGELDDFPIVEREPAPVTHRHVDDGDPLGRIVAVDHLRRLAAALAAQDRGSSRRQCRLVHVELVGIDPALHHHLAEPPGRGDEHHVLESRLGIDGERDAACAKVASDHALNADGEGDIFMGESLVGAVGDGAVVEQGGEHLTHRAHQRILAAHVEQRLLLSREGGVGKIFRRGGRTHRHRTVRGVRRHPRVARAQLAHQLLRQRRRPHPLPDLRAGGGKRPHVGDIESGEPAPNALGEPVPGQELAKRVGGGREPSGHAHPGRGQLADHLAERRVLAADPRHVGHSQRVERDDPIHECSVAADPCRRRRFGRMRRIPIPQPACAVSGL